MKIEFLSTSNRPEIQGASDANKLFGGPRSRSKAAAERQMKQMGAAREVVNYLITMDGRSHNGPAARILATASAWAYSDLTTFAAVMGACGLSGEFLAVNVTNEPNFVDTTAYLFLSSDTQGQQGRLAILTFRGTNPTNTINWLTDTNSAMEPLGEAGRAHGGFLRGGVVLLPFLKALLLRVSEGMTLKQALKDMQMNSAIPKEVFPESLEKTGETFADEEDLVASRTQGSQDDSSQTGQKPLALYLCGHSLGGAFAALTGAAIYLDPELAALRMNPRSIGGPSDPQATAIQSGLRSVFTFGQPMFADKSLALQLEGKFGERLFRHVYRNDIMPRLPPRVLGDFAHFGREYVATGGVWVRNRSLIRQVYTAALGNLIGTLAWAKDQLPVAQWIPLQFSWGDHAPLNYLRVSKAHPSGFEMMGNEVGGDVPGLC
jgi:hypothetical protein